MPGVLIVEVWEQGMVGSGLGAVEHLMRRMQACRMMMEMLVII